MLGPLGDAALANGNNPVMIAAAAAPRAARRRAVRAMFVSKSTLLIRKYALTLGISLTAVIRQLPVYAIESTTALDRTRRCIGSPLEGGAPPSNRGHYVRSHSRYEGIGPATEDTDFCGKVRVDSWSDRSTKQQEVSRCSGRF